MHEKRFRDGTLRKIIASELCERKLITLDVL